MFRKKLLEAALFLPKVKYVGHERLNMYVHRKKALINQMKTISGRYSKKVKIELCCH